MRVYGWQRRGDRRYEAEQALRYSSIGEAILQALDRFVAEAVSSNARMFEGVTRKRQQHDELLSGYYDVRHVPEKDRFRWETTLAFENEQEEQQQRRRAEADAARAYEFGRAPRSRPIFGMPLTPKRR